MAKHSTPDNKSYIWKLPQELLDKIFKPVYGSYVSRNLISKHSSSDKRKFEQALKVNEFLVSKKWFQNAAAAWVDLHDWRHGAGWSLKSSPLFAHYARKVTIASGSEEVKALKYKVPWCPDQSICLEILVDVSEFRLAGKSPYRVDFDTTDLEKLPLVQELKQLRGVTQLILTPRSYTNLTPAQEAIWKQNVAAACQLVTPQPRSEREMRFQKPGGPTPLYIGSRVTCERNELLPSDYYNYLNCGYSTYYDVGPVVGDGHPYEVAPQYLWKDVEEVFSTGRVKRKSRGKSKVIWRTVILGGS